MSDASTSRPDVDSPARLFPDLPDEARAWVYPVERALSAPERDVVLREMDRFFAEWTSHGRNVQGGAAILYDRFVIVAAVIPGGDISGCGIDKSVNALEDALRSISIQIGSNLLIYYLNEEGRADAVSRREFRDLVAEGGVHEASTVFDLGITTLGELRGNGFAREAAGSWHGRIFGIGQATA